MVKGDAWSKYIKRNKNRKYYTIEAWEACLNKI